MNIDIARHMGAVDREVREVERDGRPTRVVVASRTYDTNVDDLWDAISNPERIPRWFLPVTGDLREGGRYQLEGNAGGTITRCLPPRELSLTWEYAGAVSWVEVRLNEQAGGTRLVLEHSAEPDPHWEKYGPGAVGIGWELGLFGLALHLGSGVAVDPKAFEAWSASEAGKGFVRQSSDGWAAAGIAAGADAEQARAAAANTTAFYTGEAGGAGEGEAGGG
jgi:uncharacterized protein YndB with AHSA1/START domain